MLTLFAECYINPASYRQEYGSRFVLLNKGNKVHVLKLIQWKLLSSWLQMLLEFIYTHRHTHFYLILISLPSCLLNTLLTTSFPRSSAREQLQGKMAQQHSLSRYCSPATSSSRHKDRVSQRGFLPADAIWSLPQSCWFNTNSWGGTATALLSLGSISITLGISADFWQRSDFWELLCTGLCLDFSSLCWFQGSWAFVLSWDQPDSPMPSAACCELTTQT